MKEFYFYNWVVVFFLFFLCYMIDFRDGMTAYFRVNRMSKTKIRKSTKGWKNFWLYEQMHHELDFDGIYRMNALFLLIALLTLALHLCLGWWRGVRLPLAILFSACMSVYCPMGCFATVQHNLLMHRQPFVLWQRRKDGGLSGESMPITEGEALEYAYDNMDDGLKSKYKK